MAILFLFVSMSIFKFVTGHLPLVTFIVILLLNMEALVWLFLRKHLRLNTDILVLITFAVLSVITILTFTGQLPNALRTKCVGTLSQVYDMFFNVTILFRLVKFRYGLTLMLVPCILVKLFQYLAVAKIDRHVYDLLPSELRSTYFEPHSFAPNYKQPIESLVWNIIKPFCVLTASYMIQTFSLELLIHRYVADKSMRAYFSHAKAGILICGHKVNYGNIGSPQVETSITE